MSKGLLKSGRRGGSPTYLFIGLGVCLGADADQAVFEKVHSIYRDVAEGR